MNNTSFRSLSLARPLIDNLDSLGYQQMTEIQAETLPLTLQGKDILAQAKTGSGKTAAFGLALLHHLQDVNNQTQALVLCPTRELAEQVANELRRLARPLANTKIISLCGGKPIGAQYASLEHQPHIVVGTAGRVLKHLQKGTLKVDQLHTLVLDEADRMLDMGFQVEMMQIIKLLPEQRQTLLFSATYPDEISQLSQKIQQQAVVVQVESQHDSKNIKQIFYQIEKGERTSTLVSLMHQFKPAHSVVFCNRKHQCKELAQELWQQGFHAVALHGDLEQSDRDRVLVQFANKSSSMLIATDVAARGLDIKDLDAVINFELSPDPETHVHRIGRTGRAGNQGLALSLFMASEAPKLVAIEDYQKAPLRIDSVNTLKRRDGFRLSPPMVTLCINAGKKNKLRAGDLLGALTADKTIPGKQIGKIDLFDTIAYVAVERSVAKQALKLLTEGKIKGKKFRVRKLG